MAPAAAPQLPQRFKDQLVVGGLNYPTGMVFLPDGRLLVVEREGPIRLVVEGGLGALDPLAVVDSVASSGNRGLTGVAVDPRWPAYPYVYVYHDAMGGACRISRYAAGGDLDAPTSAYLTLDPASRYDLLRDIPDLNDGNNGGSLRFGPDSMLYAALGDDGQGCAAQDTVSLRGVVVRLDVRGLPDGPGGPPDKSLLAPPDNPFAAHAHANARLVWALGLRNPFRFQVDAVTGDLFVADVGAAQFEEVNHLQAAAANCGWPYYEGPAAGVAECPGITPGGPLVAPVYAYDHAGSAAAVVGGSVYRASACAECSFPGEYEGSYFFSDFHQGFLRRLKLVAGGWTLAPPVPGQPSGQDWGRGFAEVSDYLTGSDGALWYCRMSAASAAGTGEIHRIYYDTPIAAVPGAEAGRVEFAVPAPTPACGAVRFSYALPRAARVELRLFDLQGRAFRTLVEPGPQTAGRHAVAWDARDASGRAAPAGIYHARLVVDGAAYLQRAILAR